MRQRFFYFFMIGLFVTAYSTAQVQIQPVIPTVGLVQKTQLWNIVLINVSGSVVEGRLELSLLDRKNSLELITATTQEFKLEKGSVVFNENKAGPVVYNYIGLQPDNGFQSLLPAGAYTACYTFVMYPNSSKRIVLAEECVHFDTEPLTPPLLSFPADSSILETSPVQFNWTPPAPASMLNGLHYEVLITEVQNEQKAAEAVAENPPFFSTGSVISNFLTYPASSPAFEKNKWYAWQIIARDNNEYTGKSEVWVFRLADNKKAEEALNGTPYQQLQKTGGGKTFAVNGKLRFYYFNQLADSSVSAAITDMTESIKTDAVEFTLPLRRGENYIQKDISKYMRFIEGHVYMFSVTNSAGEKWYIIFENKKY